MEAKRLLFTADDSGATAISISADDDDSNDSDSSGLSQLAYNIDSGSFVGNPVRLVPPRTRVSR